MQLPSCPQSYSPGVNGMTAFKQDAIERQCLTLGRKRTLAPEWAWAAIIRPTQATYHFPPAGTVLHSLLHNLLHNDVRY